MEEEVVVARAVGQEERVCEMLHRSRPRAKSGAPTTPRGPPGSQQLPANSGRRVSRTPPRVRGGEQLLAKSVSPPIFDDQEEPARLARPSGKAREAGDLLPLPLGCHTNRGPASQGPQEIRDGSARTPNAPHLNVALGGFGADLMLTPTADFNETRTLEGMSSPVDISPGSGTATWVSRDARLSKIPRYQEGLRKSSEGLDQPDKQEEVLRNQNFEIRLGNAAWQWQVRRSLGVGRSG